MHELRKEDHWMMATVKVWETLIVEDGTPKTIMKAKIEMKKKSHLEEILEEEDNPVNRVTESESESNLNLNERRSRVKRWAEKNFPQEKEKKVVLKRKHDEEKDVSKKQPKKSSDKERKKFESDSEEDLDDNVKNKNQEYIEKIRKLQAKMKGVNYIEISEEDL